MLELDKREHCTFSECCLVEYVTVNKRVLSYNLYTGSAATCNRHLGSAAQSKLDRMSTPTKGSLSQSKSFPPQLFVLLKKRRQKYDCIIKKLPLMVAQNHISVNFMN